MIEKYLKNRLWIITVIFLLMFYLFSGFVISDSLDISQETVDRGLPIRYAIDGDWTGGQSFIATVDVLTRAEISVRTLGSPDFDLTLELREGSITGTLLDSQIYASDSISDGFSWIEFDFTDITVKADTTYFIRAALPPEGLSNSFGYELGYAESDNYLDGSFWYTHDSGVSWIEETDNDLAFRVYGTNDEQPSTPQLTLSVPSSVDEGDSFEAYVSSEENPIEKASVSFDGLTYSTDSNGYVNICTPSVDSDTTYEITASKTGYVQGATSIVIKNTASISINILHPNGGETLSGIVNVSWNIINPSEKDYSLTLRYKYLSDQWATIFENLETTEDFYLWDTNSLTNGYPYWLKISLNYDSATVSDATDDYFTIDNAASPSDSWIYGTVSEQSDNLTIPLEGAMVCAMSSFKSKCTFTDENGEYRFNITPGTYIAKASKQGYISQTEEDIVVQSDQGTLVDFTLEKSTEIQDKSFTDYTIEQELQKGSIIGTVDVSTDDEHVLLYNNIDIEVVSSDITSEDGIDIIVFGEGDPGTKVVIYVGEVENPEDIIVEFDGVKISQSSDIIAFFASENVNEEYVTTSTIENGVTKYVIIVNIPHYSQHQITITLEKIVDALTGTTAFIFYIGFIIILAVVFIGSGLIRRRF